MLPCNIDHPTYIDNDDELARLCEQWSKSPILALDTEFIRTDTFYPIGALLQVSDGAGCFLIDPLVLNNLAPLSALLKNPSIIKVLHSCSEDLEVFDRMLGVIPQPMFDTQLAAAMDGYGFAVGYQRLTQEMLGIHVAKGETRSNWLQRPLTQSQIHYAALDVAYLPRMYQQFHDSLSSKGRLSWLQEDCVLMLQKFSATGDIENYYKKVKSAWKLSSAELAILRELIQWRELSARERDVPRSRVLSDRSCADIARLKPKNVKALSVIDGVIAKMVREDGETVLRIVKQTGVVDRSVLPERLPRPLPAETSSLLKLLKAHTRHRAEQLQVAPEVLAKKRDFEALIRSGANNANYQLPSSLEGWRKAVIGDQLMAILLKAI